LLIDLTKLIDATLSKGVSLPALIVRPAQAGAKARG